MSSDNVNVTVKRNL